MLEINVQYVVSAFVSLLIGVFTYYTVKIYQLRQKYKHIPGPPANGLIGFYLGNTPEIVRKKREGKDLVEIWIEWFKI